MEDTTAAMRRHAATLLRLSKRAARDAEWRKSRGMDATKRSDECAALELGSVALREWASQRERRIA